jgi:hypothetical protein
MFKHVLLHLVRSSIGLLALLLLLSNHESSIFGIPLVASAGGAGGRNHKGGHLIIHIYVIADVILVFIIFAFVEYFAGIQGSLIARGHFASPPSSKSQYTAERVLSVLIERECE